MNYKKINSLIQFGKASRQIVTKQNLEYQVKKGRCRLILLANDIAPSSKEEVLKIAGNAKVLTYLDKKELGLVLSKSNVGIIGITNNNIAKEIIKLMEVDD